MTNYKEFISRLRYESEFVLKHRGGQLSLGSGGNEIVGTGRLSPELASESATPAFVGFDTNSLAKAVGDGGLADDIDQVLEEVEAIRIVPHQAVIEYWNNFKHFNNRELNQHFQFMSQLDSNLKRIPKTARFQGLKRELEGPVKELDEALREYGGERRADEVKPLLDLVVGKTGIVPALHGEQIYQIGCMRFARKAPPGFEDADKGDRALGDFYIWAEFLYGLFRLRPNGVASENKPVEWALLVTDDAKKDWKPGGSFHPVLLEEALQITGVPVQIMGFNQFTKFIDLWGSKP